MKHWHFALMYLLAFPFWNYLTGYVMGDFDAFSWSVDARYFVGAFSFFSWAGITLTWAWAVDTGKIKPKEPTQ